MIVQSEAVRVIVMMVQSEAVTSVRLRVFVCHDGAE